MAKATRETAAQRREQIVQAASRRIRERGLGGVGVPGLMAQAGLTHGGFYKHFASKDALEAEAVERALEEMAERVWALVESDGASAFARLSGDYLSPSHRDDPGGGCAIAALACDAARSPDSLAGRTLADGVERLAEILTALSPAEDPRADALARFASMVGAVVLARATASRPISDEILAAVR